MDGRRRLPNSSREYVFHRSRQEDFLAAAQCVASTFAKLPAVRRVVLFGSVASAGNEPERGPSRRQRVHEPKDVDLAVWTDDVHTLDQLSAARSRAVNQLFAETEIGVAHHQVDVFILDSRGQYLGRLCCFNSCPKGKRECEVKDCGRVPFLRQHEDFHLDADALSPSRIRVLYERQMVP